MIKYDYKVIYRMSTTIRSVQVDSKVSHDSTTWYWYLNPFSAKIKNFGDSLVIHYIDNEQQYTTR